MYPKLVENTEKICGVLAFFTNIIILLLIIFKSPKRLGAYKYLMIYISLFEFFYAILNLLSPSEIFTVDSGFLVVMDQKKSVVPVGISNILYFSMFGTSMANFGVHFIYRYFAVTGNKEYTTSTPSKLIIWISSPLIFGGSYAVSAMHFMGKSHETEQYLRSKCFNISSETLIDKLAFMGFYIYPNDDKGQKYVNWYCIIGVMVISTIITFSIAIMLYFGVKCYRELQNLTSISTVSKTYRSIQNQLFLALVFQALIPLVLMHLPSTIIGITCFLNMATEEIGVVTAVFIAFYPVLDPLPNVFIIKNYRDAFLGFFCICSRSRARVGSLFLANSVTPMPTDMPRTNISVSEV